MKLSRRDFIHAGCLAGAITLAPHFFDQAKAGINNPGGGSGSTSFNGGKSQVNFNFLYGGGEYPFLNNLLTAAKWSFASGGPVTPDMLDTNSYPTTLTNTYGVTATGVYLNYFVPPQSGAGARPGFYVMAWTGNGTVSTGFTANVVSPSTAAFTGSVSANILTITTTPSNTVFKGMPLSVGGYIGIQLSGSAGGSGTYQTIGAPNAGSQAMSVSAGNLTSSGGSGRFVFNSSTAQQYFFQISAIGSPYISNAYVCHVDDEAAYLAGQIWGTQFLARLAQGRPGNLRFLNWMGATGSNQSNVSNWYTANKPQTYAYYYDTEMRSALYAGLTTLGSTGAYTANAPLICSANGAAWDGILRDKTTVTVLWDRSGYAGVTAAAAGTTTQLTVNTGSFDTNGFQIGETVTIAGVTGGTWTGLNATTTVSAVGAGLVTVNIDSSGFTGSPSFASAFLYHGSLSFNVGGTGAKAILGSQSGVLFASQYPTAGSAVSVATLVYDAVLNSWIKRGGDQATGTYGVDNGVPFALMRQLCAKVGAHIWIPAYYLACTPVTDYIPSLITDLKTNGPSWMIPFIEGPNEQWNPGFLANGYATAVGTAYGWASQQVNDWYGKVISTWGQAMSQLYGGDTTKYRMICGVQTGTGGSPGAIATSNPRLSSAQYIGQTPQSSLSGSWGTITFSSTVGVAEAWRWTTHVCCANYYNPSLYGTTSVQGTPNEADLATAFAGGDNTAPTTYANSIYCANSVVTFAAGSPGIVAWPNHGLSANAYLFFRTLGTFISGVGSSSIFYVKTVIDADHFTISSTPGGTAINFTGSATGTTYAFNTFNPTPLQAVAVILQNWKAWAQSFSVQKMCFYEGGYSPDYSSSGVSNVDLLRAASKVVATMSNNPLGMQGALIDNYNNCTALSGGGFTGEFPSLFQFGGKTPSNNAWSILENVYVSPDPPQWNAIVAFNH